MEGLTTIPSNFAPSETMDRLETVIKAHGMTVFARINHAALAAEAELASRPTEVIVFGNPRAGTGDDLHRRGNRRLAGKLSLARCSSSSAGHLDFCLSNRPASQPDAHHFAAVPADHVPTGTTDCVAVKSMRCVGVICIWTWPIRFTSF